MKKHSGFTLVELIVTLTVLVILLAVGVPSFISTIRINNVVTETNRMVTSLMVARSEAVKRRMQVTVAKTGQEWEEGWRIFSDLDGDGVLDVGDGDTVLKIYTGMRDGFTLRSGNNIEDWVAYQSTGLGTGSGGLPSDTFRLCDDSQDTETGRSIILNNIGRVRLVEGTVECP